MRSTFNILFYVNKSKEKNGMVPVMGRVTINGTQSQFSCKKTIPLDMWDVKGNCAKGRGGAKKLIVNCESVNGELSNTPMPFSNPLFYNTLAFQHRLARSSQSLTAFS